MNQYFNRKVLSRAALAIQIAFFFSASIFTAEIAALAEKKISTKSLNEPGEVQVDVPLSNASKLGNLDNSEILIDSVIASVDGIPITLREFSDKVVPKRNLSLSDFANDPSLSKTLDALIMERLIEAEANARRLKATDEDIQKYMAQVGAQNHMTVAEFELALQEQGRSVDDFKSQARIEILRSRLMGQIAQSAPAVTDDELGADPSDSEEVQELGDTEAKVRFHLREIVLLKVEGQEEQAEIKSTAVSERLQAGEDFANLAREFSQGATSESGGDLGELAEDDLSEVIKDGVSELSPGEYTDAIDMEDAIRYFMLIKKFEEGETSHFKSDLREALRKELENRKLEKRFEEFFTVELPKLHKVDRKV